MKNYVGTNPDELSLRERSELAGQWLALEIYHPANLAMRRISAVGPSPDACRRSLQEQGKEPAAYQYVLSRGVR